MTPLIEFRHSLNSKNPELPDLVQSDIVPVLFTYPAFDVAIATKDRLAWTGLERHPGSFAALSTVYRKHLPPRVVVLAGILIPGTLGFFYLTAGGTTPGFIGETPRRMELLLGN
jgi:hypothetical protein